MNISRPVVELLSCLTFDLIYGVFGFSLLFYSSFLIRKNKNKIKSKARVSVCTDDEPKVGHDIREK